VAACTDLASPARSRIGMSFPAVFRNFNVGAVSITVSISPTVASIPPANLAIRHIVSKPCSTCRAYHVGRDATVILEAAMSDESKKPLRDLEKLTEEFVESINEEPELEPDHADTRPPVPTKDDSK
jgi:hypothetical protein